MSTFGQGIMHRANIVRLLGGTEGKIGRSAPGGP
jgi:hypothetical protein